MFDEALFEKGKLAFNSAQFFEAHDIWEEIWQNLRQDPAKKMEAKSLQALIQLAVSLHLIQENRLVGAKKVLERARLNIKGANELINNVNIGLYSNVAESQRACSLGEARENREFALANSLYQEIIRFLGNSDLENCLNVKI